jgi:AcrR family transcriptional regulator
MTVADRRLREKEQRRQQILAAARDIFFKKGFEGTTIEEIAAGAELSKGALYLYFASKEEIYITLMHEGSRILHDMLQKAGQSDLPADTLLRRVGRAYLKFYEQYPEYFRMLFLYYITPGVDKKISDELRESCRSDAKDSLSLVASLVEKGIRDKIFRPCNPGDFAVLLWTCQNGIILLGERGDPEFLKLNITIEKLHDLYLESMIVSLKAGR